MELTKQNLELVETLLEDKIDFHLMIITNLKIDIDRNTPNGFRLSESMQIKHDDNKKALVKARENRLECYELLEQVRKELELKKNCEGTFITGFHD
tara:strand:+ start:76 stop:363 length:288 start_codon:yes stop_codon:yes gene_type:complete